MVAGNDASVGTTRSQPVDLRELAVLDPRGARRKRGQGRLLVTGA